MKNATLCFYVLLFFATLPLGAQTQERQADFMIRNAGDTVLFAPILPSLVQMAGAPKAYYDHYWEFGDGSFSFKENPCHVYADTSSREVYYLATGKYDNGKAPRSRKKKTTVPKAPVGAYANAGTDLPAVLPHPQAPLGLRAVRSPKAGEELACIFAYSNQTPAVQSGTLYLFFNQRSYRHDHFGFIKGRPHYGEQEVLENIGWNGQPDALNGWAGVENDLENWYTMLLPARQPEEALSELEKRYKSSRSWRFEGLTPGALRHLFVSFNATDSMVADTHAIITLTGLLISDDQQVVEQYELEMEIVASHDPNYIAVTNPLMGFRRVRKKEMVYKVRFQNDGEGPARKIEVACDVPRGLDASGLQILDLYPQCLLCPDGVVEWSCIDTSFQEGKIVFTFRNIYLPGTQQQGVGDQDSTKGFIKYRLLPSKKIRKTSFNSSASIVFDKNPPIHTNRATTVFKPGLSPGVMAGWNIFPDAPELNQLTVGTSIAPFSPYRRFFQMELWGSVGRQSKTAETFPGERGSRVFQRNITEAPSLMDSVITAYRKTKQSSFSLDLIPLEMRKNISDWLSLGAGAMVTIGVNTTTLEKGTQIERQLYDGMFGVDLTIQTPRSTLTPVTDPAYPAMETLQSSTESSHQTKLGVSLFADLHLGMVRKGPSIAFRPLLRLGKKPAFYASVFACFKF